MRMVAIAVIAVVSTCGGCSVLFYAMAARAQTIAGGQTIAGVPWPSTKGHVTFSQDLVQIESGKPEVVEIRFRVDDGFHINSHSPSNDLLIPTEFKLEPVVGIKVVEEHYPKGSAFHLDADPKEVLDVYQGEFRVRLTVVAGKGDMTLHGTLHYQACDKAACFPPRTLPVEVLIHGK